MAATGSLTREDLRRIDLLAELDDEAIDRWVAVADVREFAPGQLLADQGDDRAGLQLLLEGVVEALVVDGDRTEPAGRHVAPTWLGAIPLLTETAFAVRMQADTECRVAVVPREHFLDLALSQRPVMLRIMRQVRPVLTRLSARTANRERLAALGTMSAGLAHELNNPAAAARRAAAEMAEVLDVLGSTIGHFVEAGVEREQAQQLVALQRQALQRAEARGPLGTLDAADAEDELLELLEDRGVEDAWRLAEPLAAAGITADWLEEVAAHAGAALAPALQWVAASLTARGLAAELSESAERMSRLVGAVKAYAYMDRGDVVEVDLHEGIETTLTILGHKLRHTSIEVVRDYDRSLPKLMARGPELNQVWTNLLDNAIDALGERGTITITTRRDAGCALVCVADDGPGIPADVIGRVFDPFFTTKGVGKGTGLGLDTARRIVADRHRGSITVESEPGRTAFRVRLPFDAARRT